MGTKGQPPRLTVKGEEAPIEMTALSVDCRVAGMLAEVSFLMTFTNPHPRVLETELQFPLPDGAAVSGFGIEINGNIVDAVPVEKEAARVAFEEAVRSGHDAGLVEEAKGNVFTTRVYPVPANGSKRVKVAYEVQLDSAALVIPLCSSAPLKFFEIHVQVSGSAFAPVVKDAADLSGVAFAAAGPSDGPAVHELSASFNDVVLERPLVVGLPALEPEAAAKSGPEVCVAADPVVAGETFFIVNDFVEIPSAAAPSTEAGASAGDAKGRVLLLYDASLSRAKCDRGKEAALIRRVLSHLRDKEHITDVDVIVFRNSADPPKPFSLATAEGIDGALGAIEGALYDGGTNLACLQSIAELSKAHPWRLGLLFTDGLATLGAEVPGEGAYAVPLHVFCGDPKANPDVLRYVAQQSGGLFHNVASPSFNEGSVLEALSRAKQFSFISATAGKDVVEVFPSHPVAISGTNGTRFSVTGRLTNNAPTEITLNYGFGTDVTRSVKVAIPASGGNRNAVVSRFWARRKVEELSVFGDKHKEEVAAIGRKFGFVTAGTSLLVLESLEQYMKHGIVPNARGLPEVHEQYMRRKKEEQDQEERRVDEKLRTYAEKWGQHVKWWENSKDTAFLEKLIQKERETRSEQREHKRREAEEKANSARMEALHGMEQEEAKLQGEIDALAPPKEEPKDKDRKKDSREKERSKKEKKADSESASEECDDEVCAKEEECAPEQSERMMDMSREMEREEAPRMKSKKMAAPARRNAAPAQTSAARMSLMSASCDSAPPPPPPCCAAPCAAPPPPGGAPQQLLRQMEQQQQQPSAAAPAAPAAPEAPAAAPTASISLKSWDPNTPYVTAIKNAFANGIDIAYQQYINERETQGGAPAFYLDCCEVFYRTFHDKQMAMRILTSVVEIGIEEPQLYRIVGYKLDEFAELDLAIAVFERVLKLRPKEPQSHRDLANVLVKAGRYNEALREFWEVVTGQWDGRYDEIELTALTELNRLLWLAETKNAKVDIPAKLDKRFRSPVDVDLRISMAWDTDMTDVDLHTIEPTGEECYYGNKSTSIGGQNSRDFTRGYGPEWYMCRFAPPGLYKIRAKYYSNSQQNLTGGTTILLTLFTNFSRPNEDMQLITIRLAQSCDIVDVGEITFQRELSAKEKQKFDAAVKEEDQKDASEIAGVEKNAAREAEAAKKQHDKRMKDLQSQLEKLKKKAGAAATTTAAPDAAPAATSGDAKPSEGATKPTEPAKPPAHEEGDKGKSKSCVIV